MQLTTHYEKLNEDIRKFQQVVQVREDMRQFKGVSRLVLLDRYTFKDTLYITLSSTDLLILTVKDDSKFPARGIGIAKEVNWDTRNVLIEVEEEFQPTLDIEEEYRKLVSVENEFSVLSIEQNVEEQNDQIETEISALRKKAQAGLVVRKIEEVEKPLEISWEQVSARVATGLSSVEVTEELRNEWFHKFNDELKDMNLIPAGRVLYGAGSGSDVTYFNCYVMPYVPDSREGIAEHRKNVMEIMSRGGGVGTNGSTLRPRNTLAKGVNGKSSGAISWLDDIAKLTHLVEQGGSRRGAQMIMLAAWHPDIIEFVISKMQNPDILRVLIRDSKEPMIVKAAKEKLKITPLTTQERELYEEVVNNPNAKEEIKAFAQQQLDEGQVYSVHNSEFMTGANISVCITKELMQAVENNEMYELKFPDVENYDQELMSIYNAEWHKIGDVREWEALGYPVRTYAKIDANELWDLINFCATFSAEPGIFFLDNANDMTNARSYGQKVVATNPCGEQPLAPFSVCNLSAVNLAEMATPEKTVDYQKLKKTVEVAVRMGDNVIDATPYFLEENKKQALSERRVGLKIA